MAIKTLESYLFEKGIVGVLPIEILKNCRLAIDVEHYISRLINAKKELFLDAIGGFPNTLQLYIQSDLKTFKELNITPVFVFKGLKVNAQFQVLKSDMNGPATKIRQASWDQYYARYDKPVSSNNAFLLPLNNLSFKTNNNPNSPSNINSPASANTAIGSGGSGSGYGKNISYANFDTTNFLNDLVKFFQKLNLEYVVSPYSSWSQLNYLYSNNFVDVIYGPTECLLASHIDKFILGMEFQSKEFRFLDKKNLLHDFRLTNRQFKEIAVVVGFDVQPYSLTSNFSSFVNPDLVDFKWLHEFVLNGNSVYSVILNNSKKTKVQTSLDRFKDGISTLEFIPVMKSTGRVELLMEPDGGFPPLEEITQEAINGHGISPDKKDSKARVPNDIHEFIGQRLPHEYYFYQSVGLISPKLLEAVAFGSYLELPPLDGGKNNQYKNLVNSKGNLEIKNKILNLLTSSMARYFQVKKLDYIKYFDFKNETPFDFRMNRPLFFKLAHYLVKSKKEQQNGEQVPFDLTHLLTQFSDKSFLASIDHDTGVLESDARLQSGNEILSTAVTRLLYLYDFISLNDNQLTGWGQILPKIGEIASNTKEAENLLLLLIFFKDHASTKTLASDKIHLHDSFTPAIAGEPKVSSEDALIKKYILILTRLSLFHEASNNKNIINSNNMNKLSLNLLAFRSLFQFTKTQFNELNQSAIVSLLCNNQFDRKKFTNNKQWKTLVDQVPLKGNLPSTISAIVAEVYFEHIVSEEGASGSKESRINSAKAFITKNYGNHMADVLSNLNESFDFVKKALVLMEEISNAKLIPEDYAKVLKGAKEFLIANI